ncbi:MAG TPA: DUF4143 domain-containing protein [Clostridia bacterium]|jgi:predicted AAA+ superfamily ATPase|nr:ATP-binding protein [Clostridia bacterium]HQM96003.1 DUF4143 domain-containing protein [Clostridia bacterium]HQO69044.1 DUF4143 domain-containing protein [Clostridia bacterium]
MKKYYPRIADKILKEELEAFGAVLINGPKWCGKTTTAKQIAKSVINMQDPSNKANYQKTVKIEPLILLQGDKPRLIDEWQEAPELWDAIRYDIDEKQQEGLYILTGSTKIDDIKISHSGVGRISKILMRTLSLYESNDSNGSVSLQDLFNGNAFKMAKSDLSVRDISEIIVRGGWPNSIGKDLKIASRQIAGYIDSIVKSEINTVDGVERDEAKTRAVLKSLARHTASQASDNKIISDVEVNHFSIHRNTLSDYLKILRDLYVIEDLPAWSPKLRSKTTIRTSNTRHFSDPAFAASLLDASPEDLFRDIETFGLLFESLVVRDLRIYTEYIGGYVYHYRDKNGLEADAIIHLNDGRWAAIEVKLGSHEIDNAARNLIKLSNQVDSSNSNGPAFLMVITGTEFGYRRDDGVYVVPIGCLKY